VAAVDVGLAVADDGAGATEDAGATGDDGREAAGLEAVGDEIAEGVGLGVEEVALPQAVSKKEMTKIVTRGISTFFTITSSKEFSFSINSRNIKLFLKYNLILIFLSN